MQDAFLLFFTPQIEKRILDNSNAYGASKHGDQHIEIDFNLLRAYIGVLILSGVYRYVPFLFYFFCFFVSLIQHFCSLDLKIFFFTLRYFRMITIWSFMTNKQFCFNLNYYILIIKITFINVFLILF